MITHDYNSAKMCLRTDINRQFTVIVITLPTQAYFIGTLQADILDTDDFMTIT